MTICFFPRVWAKGSSKSGGLLYIFTCSHLHIRHMFPYSHLLIFTPSHLHIFLPSHLHISLPSHLLTFTSSHLHIFTSSHLHIFTSSHLLTFTSSHLHIFSPGSPSHLLIFASSHLHIFSLCLLPSVTVSLLLFHVSLKAAGSADEAPWYGHPSARNEASSVQNWCFFAILRLQQQTFRTKFESQKLMFFASLVGLAATFRAKRGSSVKNGWFFCDFTTSAATLSREMRFECQKLTVFCDFGWSGGSAGVCV